MSALIDHRRDLELVAPRRGAAPHYLASDRKPEALRSNGEGVSVHTNAGAAQ